MEYIYNQLKNIPFDITLILNDGKSEKIIDAHIFWLQIYSDYFKSMNLFEKYKNTYENKLVYKIDQIDNVDVAYDIIRKIYGIDENTSSIPIDLYKFLNVKIKQYLLMEYQISDLYNIRIENNYFDLLVKVIQAINGYENNAKLIQTIVLNCPKDYNLESELEKIHPNILLYFNQNIICIANNKIAECNLLSGNIIYPSVYSEYTNIMAYDISPNGEYIAFISMSKYVYNLVVLERINYNCVIKEKINTDSHNSYIFNIKFIENQDIIITFNHIIYFINLYRKKIEYFKRILPDIPIKHIFVFFDISKIVLATDKKIICYVIRKNKSLEYFDEISVKEGITHIIKEQNELIVISKYYQFKLFIDCMSSEVGIFLEKKISDKLTINQDIILKKNPIDLKLEYVFININNNDTYITIYNKITFDETLQIKIQEVNLKQSVILD